MTSTAEGEKAMALVQWNPWTEMEALRREVDRLFDTHVAEMFGNGHTQRVTWSPRLDVRELDHAFVVEADLPGMKLEDITVSLENNALVIAGERKATWSNDEGRPTHRELSYGAFQRALTLPTAVNADQVEATYTNGVLTVTIPKAAEARTKRIAIQAA
jgi:HSP20 family protein